MLSAVHPGSPMGMAKRAEPASREPNYGARGRLKSAITRGILPAARRTRNGVPGVARKLDAASAMEE